MLKRLVNRQCISLHRSYSTAPKPTLQLVAELRKLTETSISKAREALSATNNDVSAALSWLQNDLAESGAKKAAKVQGRVAKEGLIGVCILSGGTGHSSGLGGIRAAMVELNCETDFVGRNELFGKLVSDIAHTAAYISEPVDSEKLFAPCPLDILNDSPLLPSDASRHDPSQSSISTAIRDTIAKVGENISLRRAITFIKDPFPPSSPYGLRVANYVHGAVSADLSQGRMSSLVAVGLKSTNLGALLQSKDFRTDLGVLERSVARQIVGMGAQTIRSDSSNESTSDALYAQPFMMYPQSPEGASVEDVLRIWGREHGLEGGEEPCVEIVDFVRWQVGEHIEPS
ncbi:hypothetical protein SISSUDRAFT_1039589 [Sistotremastrum suecicum HHB10207 ss-3]|uniref:Elongation factor Ts, mitochondrial n=1 Tax=Sistotremastrum suecicum HHB10207 ss-3 TaxID=1314776 RepID=A0A166IGF0_9AGAM|nr:hypothetical protein SISSUDRAFT_1039589 [Sistotremastrum suecicum HHB10207 ss-3]